MTLPLDLALQGGGAHGAFTWGVLDRLLEEPGIAISAISGASAGAMNAVVLADGLRRGGTEGARAALARFWRAVSQAGRGARAFTLSHEPPLPEPFRSAWRWAAAPWLLAAETLGRRLSPYDFNPLNVNPLGRILAELVDFEGLRRPGAVRLFVSATDVRTGGLRLFSNADMSADAVLASACLPNLFQAVEIGEHAYWDGGYIANPPLPPLIAEGAADDLLVVQLNPPRRETVPRSADEILARLNEVSFNVSLVKELRGICNLKRALEQEPEELALRHPGFARLRALRLHRIAADEDTFGTSRFSKIDPDWAALQRLHGEGRRAAEAWLIGPGREIGRRSTLDYDAV